MTVGTGNFPELLWPGIHDIWQDEYTKYSPLYEKLFAVKQSDKAFEKEQGVISLPLAGIKNQGAQIPMVDPLQGYQKEYVNATYALGSSITREMYEDDQYNVINRIPAYIADSMRVTQETVHHDIFNNGFSTALAADGLAIFHVSHVLVGTGGTLSNMGQSGVTYALSQTTMEQALIFISRWTDDQGKPINESAVSLAVPSEQRFVAEKILKTEYEVDTANNTINPIRGMMPLVVTPYLTDTDSWFLITSVTTKRKTGFVSYNRRAAEMDRDSDFNTQNLLFSGSMRFSCGATDWRGGWGSSGA